MSDDATINQTEEKSDSHRGGNRNRRRGGGHAPKKRLPEQSLNLNELRELADLVSEHGFTDFEFENENIRVRLSKNPAPQFVQTAAPIQTTASVAASSAKTVEHTESAKDETTADENLQTITSPIVGTLYRAPSPDKDPYIKEGDNIAVGTVVCIVEAMKLMNEIESEFAGEVIEIYIENGQPVEFGQPLFGIRK